MGWTGCRATEFKSGRIDRKSECEKEIASWWKDGRQSLVKSALKGSIFYGAIKNNQSGEVWGLTITTALNQFLTF